MWRALFTAIGITTAVVGLECMVIEKAILRPKGDSPSALVGGKEIVPPDWAPWSLVTAGVIVVIYSFTIPRRVAG